MPSNAYTTHLVPLLADAEALSDNRAYLAIAPAGLPASWPAWEEAINRAVVVTCVSAWEGYVEELVREAFQATRPAGPGVGFWPVLRSAAETEVGRFNTPNSQNVWDLLRRTVGVPDVRTAWVWAGHTADQARNALDQILALRHRLSHGVNPRPPVPTLFATDLPDFFRNLAGVTDAAVREYLVTAFGVIDPWPA